MVILAQVICNRNKCFETIMNCHWKPEKAPNLALKRPKPIKCDYQVTSCLNMWAAKACSERRRENQPHHIYLEVKFRSNFHSWKIEKKEKELYILLSVTLLIEKSNHRRVQFEKSWIYAGLPPVHLSLQISLSSQKDGISLSSLNINGLLDSVGDSHHDYESVSGKGFVHWGLHVLRKSSYPYDNVRAGR